MSVSDYLRVLGRNWIVILLSVSIPVLIVAWLSNQAVPIYRASASTFVSQSLGDTPNALAQGSLFVQSQMQSYAQLASKPVVLDPVIEELGLEVTAKQLAPSVKATIPPDTQIIRIEVTNTSPEKAADIANAVAEQLAVTAESLAPKNQAGNPTVEITTVEEATPPTTPISPNTQRNVMMAGFAGLILGIGLAFLRSYLDTRVRTTKEVLEVAKVPLLAEIPANEAMTKGKSILPEEPGGPTLEQYRRLRANLRFVAINHNPLILSMSSAVAGEGKTTVVSNLALTFARSGSRTLVIDADLRKQRMSSLLGVENSVGLTSVLTGQVGFREALHTVRTSGGPLYVLTAGEIPPNPVELLGSQPMRELIESIRGDFDTIIIDTPAIVPVVDAMVVAGWVSGTLLVARPDHVQRRDLESAVESLSQAGASVLGVVVNGSEKARATAYYTATNAGKPSTVGDKGTTRRRKSAPAKPPRRELSNTRA